MEINKVFSNAGTTVLNTLTSALPIVCGVPLSAFADIPDNYKVVITSVLNDVATFAGKKQTITIRALLQDKISLKVGSTWTSLEQLMEVDSKFELADTLANALGRSLRSSVTTNRKWSGSTPVQMSLRLRFEAFNDVKSEVLAPCLQLQSLALPRGGILGTFFLKPPGPTPWKITADQVGLTGDNTEINIGQFLVFKSIVIDEVEVIFENRMSQDGPIGATVNVLFSTYQMLTKEALQESYQGELKITTSSTEIRSDLSGKKAINPGLSPEEAVAVSGRPIISPPSLRLGV